MDPDVSAILSVVIGGLVLGVVAWCGIELVALVWERKGRRK